MLPGPDDALRVLVLGPLLLVLPGYLLLLGVAPRWGHLARATVGATTTMALLSLLVWGAHAWGAMAFEPRLVWAAYGAILALGAAAAVVTRRDWSPLPWPRLERKHALLAAALVLALALLERPRLGYALPLHVDEWWHLMASQAMERQGRLDPLNSIFGKPFGVDVALTYHVLLGAIQMLTGANWLGVFRYLPLVFGALLVTTAFAAGDREGYGWEAALLVALLPTSVRVLGPQYVVPLALGLLLIPAAFLLFTSPHPRRALPLLAAQLVFLYFAHPQSAAAAGILVGTYALLTARRSLWKSGALLALAALPFVFSFLFHEEILRPEQLLEARSTLPVPEFVLLFGPLAATLFLAGAHSTFVRPSPERLAWVATSFVHLLLVVLFVLWGIGHPNLYDRAWMHGIFTMSMTAAYALHRLRLALHGRVPGPALRRAAFTAVAGLLVLASATAQGQREEGYYHVIGSHEVEDLAWIRANVEPEGHVALVDPWKASAFSTLTGLHVYAAHPHGGGGGSAIQAERLLAAGAADERALQRGNVTILWTDAEVENANFTQVHPRVWMRTNP